jgi:hypothetical protein
MSLEAERLSEKCRRSSEGCWLVAASYRIDPRSIHTSLFGICVGHSDTGTDVSQGLGLSFVIFIIPMLRTFISFVYHRPYLFLVNDSIIKGKASVSSK